MHQQEINEVILIPIGILVRIVYIVYAEALFKIYKRALLSIMFKKGILHIRASSRSLRV